MGGWFYAMTSVLGLKNVFLRRDQIRRADDESFCLRLARRIGATKIRNQRSLLQRTLVDDDSAPSEGGLIEAGPTRFSRASRFGARLADRLTSGR